VRRGPAASARAIRAPYRSSPRGTGPKKPGRTERAPALPAALSRAYARYLKVALALPGTQASGAPSARVHHTPAVKVQGRLLSRWRTEAEGALALRCDFLDRQILLQTQPEAFFLTDHYRNYPMVLVRLDKVSRDALRQVTERAWRFVAPAALVKRFEQGRSRSRRRPAS